MRSWFENRTEPEDLESLGEGKEAQLESLQGERCLMASEEREGCTGWVGIKKKPWVGPRIRDGRPSIIPYSRNDFLHPPPFV